MQLTICNIKLPIMLNLLAIAYCELPIDYSGDTNKRV